MDVTVKCKYIFPLLDFPITRQVTNKYLHIIAKVLTKKFQCVALLQNIFHLLVRI